MTRLYMLFSSLLAVWLNHLHQPTTVVLMWCVQMCVHVCVCVFLAIQQYNSLPLVSLLPPSHPHTRLRAVAENLVGLFLREPLHVLCLQTNKGAGVVSGWAEGRVERGGNRCPHTLCASSLLLPSR